MQVLTCSQHTVIKIIAIVLLSAITVGFFGLYERYEFTGEDILGNAGFKQEFKSWEKNVSRGTIVVEGQGVVRLYSQDGKEIMYVRQHVRNIQGYRFLKFTGKMRAEGVAQGKKPWQAVHLLAIGVDARGRKLWHGPYLFAKRHGTNDWQYFEQVFKINGEAEDFLVNIQLSMVKGTVWVKGLSLRPVNEKSAYKIYWGIAIILWSIVVLWILIDYFINYSFNLKQVPAAIFIAGVTIGILMPHQIVMRLNEFLLSLSPWVTNAESLASGTGIANMFAVWHFSAFALLASVIFWRMKSSRHLVHYSGLLVLFAAVTEVLQLLVDSRKSESMDFIADIAGISFALILLSAWCAIRWMFGRKMVKSS